MNRDNISDIRRDYGLNSLSKATVDCNPMVQFQEWFNQALKADFHDPNAMVVSTVSKDSFPSSRIVLLKGITDSGFIFYTNYQSQKGKELSANNAVSLLFWWDKLERQVRIEGTVTKISREDSEQYFLSRPRLSQIGAHASNQSQIIDNSQQLKEQLAKVEEKFRDKEVTLPTDWGGYLVTPTSIEFWQGQPSRLHDRLKYSKNEQGEWNIDRLSP